MKKYKTIQEAGEDLKMFAEKERKEVAAKAELQKQIKAGNITSSGKPIIRFGNFPKNSCRN